MSGTCWLRAGRVALALAGVAGVQAGEAEPAAIVQAAEKSAPPVFYTKPGRFEIVVSNVFDAQPALAIGRSVWAALAEPLGLPEEGFNSPVSVRLVPADRWTGLAPFTVTAETPGRVSVRVRWSNDVDLIIVRRALVQGLILRQAVAWHGIGAQLTVPLWLEHAFTGWSLVRDRPALRDAFQQESEGIADPPPLRALLSWQRGKVASRGWELASLWLFLQLQAEAGDFSRWGGWVRGVVGGAEPFETLPRSYTGLWADPVSMELWWQVGFYHQSRHRVLPAMSTETSRSWLADRSRWLAGRAGLEVVLSLGELRELRDEPWVRAELIERIRQTRAILGVIHPFYANAAISMGRLYETALTGDEEQFKQARADFERDAIDGRELEDTVDAILDTAPTK